MNWWRSLRRRAGECLGSGSWLCTLCRTLLVLAALGLGGLLFVSAGLMPIAASEGHWAITRVFLQFTMARSVATHTIGLEAPPLDDPAMVLKGAGHYATGCMPCHGGPGVPRSEIVMHMVPEPPELSRALESLSAEDAFWIVKHGIKYTAMPAWPSQQRDDEVWAMVAFLQRLPELDPGEFRRLAYGENAELVENVRIEPILPILQSPLSGNCVRCHGSDGAGRGSAAFPRLAGQSEAYLLSSLQAFARGQRHSGIMEPVAAGLDAQQMGALAEYYSDLEPAATTGFDGRNDDRNTEAIARGARLATHGDGDRRIPACAACHGPGTIDRNPVYPRLAGQYAGYLELQLRLFKHENRGGTAYAHIMRIVAKSLTERDIHDLALYYASLSPRSAASDSTYGSRAAPQ